MSDFMIAKSPPDVPDHSEWGGAYRAYADGVEFAGYEDENGSVWMLSLIKFTRDGGETWEDLNDPVADATHPYFGYDNLAFGHAGKWYICRVNEDEDSVITRATTDFVNWETVHTDIMWSEVIFTDTHVVVSGYDLINWDNVRLIAPLDTHTFAPLTLPEDEHHRLYAAFGNIYALHTEPPFGAATDATITLWEYDASAETWGAVDTVPAFRNNPNRGTMERDYQFLVGGDNHMCWFRWPQWSWFGLPEEDRIGVKPTIHWYDADGTMETIEWPGEGFTVHHWNSGHPANVMRSGQFSSDGVLVFMTQKNIQGRLAADQMVQVTRDSWEDRDLYDVLTRGSVPETGGIAFGSHLLDGGSMYRLHFGSWDGAESFTFILPDGLFSSAIAQDDYDIDDHIEISSTAEASDDMSKFTARSYLLTDQGQSESTALLGVSLTRSDEAAAHDDLFHASSIHIRESAQAADLTYPGAIVTHSVTDTVTAADAAHIVIPTLVNDEALASDDQLVGVRFDLSDAATASDDLFTHVMLSPTIMLSDTANTTDFVTVSTHTFPVLNDGAIASDDLFTKDLDARSWVLNPETGAVSTHTNWPIVGIAQVGDLQYAVGPEGLYLLDGDTDDGDTIDAVIDLPGLEFGQPNKEGGLTAEDERKRVKQLWLDCESDTPMRAEVRSYDQALSHHYTAIRPLNQTGNMLITVGKGLKSKWWGLSIRNTLGGDFRLTAASADVMTTDRRR